MHPFKIIYQTMLLLKCIWTSIVNCLIAIQNHNSQHQDIKRLLLSVIVVSVTIGDGVADDTTTSEPKSTQIANTPSDEIFSIKTKGELKPEYNQAFYLLNALNAGMPSSIGSIDLQTPMSTLQYFEDAATHQDYRKAAHALNLNLIPPLKQAIEAPELARKLDYLLTNSELYVYKDLPDRPDGQVRSYTGVQQSLAGEPRRSIKLGDINYKERKVPIFIQRVQVGDNAPVWVFSASTVGHIDKLYAINGPSILEQNLPEWSKVDIFGMALWEYLAVCLLLAIALAMGWLINRLTSRITQWLDHPKLNQLISHVTLPMALSIAFGIVYGVTSGSLVPFHGAIATSTRPIFWILFIGCVAWLGIRSIDYIAEHYRQVNIEEIDQEEFKKERRRRTYLSIGRRVFTLCVIVIGIWVTLAKFTDVELLSKTLLTSAGIFSVILGIAAQPTLGNIVAGIQVAITQPVRIGDTVVYKGIWSTVEDLQYTYAVFKTWDERRLIVPMRDIINETIENWSHTDPHQAGAVYLYVDYGVDVDIIRQEFRRVVKANELWCGEQEPELLVTSVSDEGIKLRGKASAASPNDAWALECEIREKMLKFIAHFEDGLALPAERIIMQPMSNQDMSYDTDNLTNQALQQEKKSTPGEAS